MPTSPDAAAIGPASNKLSCAIAVMAKAPRAGRVKTRLVPPLTPAQAMAMSASFLRDITANLHRAAAVAPVHPYVAFAPAGEEALFDGLLEEGTRLVLADGSGIEASAGVEGFGRSLLHAARALFDRGYGAVCLLNADSPTLPTALLQQAATALAAPGDRVVLGPADDGGYYLIGMKAPHARLFAEIDWSTDAVAAQTRTRIAELDLPLVMLPGWYDVDDRAALARLIGETSDRAPASGGLRPFAAPATADCTRRMGLADILGAAVG